MSARITLTKATLAFVPSTSQQLRIRYKLTSAGANTYQTIAASATAGTDGTLTPSINIPNLQEDTDYDVEMSNNGNNNVNPFVKTIRTAKNNCPDIVGIDHTTSVE
jgi:hypothetical protein